jgi:putative CocE/NonD family hydrolase
MRKRLPVGQLYPTSNLFSKGHRLRLDISSSNFPHFDLNPNTGEEFESKRTVIAENTVYHTEMYPSHIVLPVQTHTNFPVAVSMDEVASSMNGQS